MVVFANQEQSAQQRKAELEKRLLQRLGKHHSHVENVLLKIKNEDVGYQQYQTHPHLMKCPAITKSFTSSPKRDRIVRAAAQRAVQAIQRRKFNHETVEKSKRVERNRVKKLESRREKCRNQVYTAQNIGRKVRAARTIQRLARKYLFNHDETPDKNVRMISGAMLTSKAASKIHNWIGWRKAVALNRFYSVDVTRGKSPCSAVSRIISDFVNISPDRRYDFADFESCQTAMQDDDVLQDASCFLQSLHPMVPGYELRQMWSTRAFLSCFLIASHPNEVLRGVEMGAQEVFIKIIHNRSVQAIHFLVGIVRNTTPLTRNDLYDIALSLQAYFVTFEAWRALDLDLMSTEITRSIASTYAIYLCEEELLKLINHLSAKFLSVNYQDDPLKSLRIEHEAGLEGSKRHLSRLKQALSRILDHQQSHELIQKAKTDASLIFEKTFFAQSSSLKEKVMTIYESKNGNLSPQTAISIEESILNFDGIDRDTVTVPMISSPKIPKEKAYEAFLTNESIVHEVLICEENEFHQLTLDGNPRIPNVCVHSFFSEWKNCNMIPSIASNMFHDTRLNSIHFTFHRAFFDKMVDDLIHIPPVKESYDSVVCYLQESIENMVPNQKNVSFPMNKSKDNAQDIQAIFDRLMHPLLEIANILSKVESQDRLTSTLEWLHEAQTQLAIQSKYSTRENFNFIASSLVFLLIKVYICEADIRNSSLQLATPYIRTYGEEYEREYFHKTYGLELPATRTWINTSLKEINNSGFDAKVMISSMEQRTSLLSMMFVDGLLFTKARLEFPEVFIFDHTRLKVIRDTSRLAVIACALALHACNVAKVGVGILSSKQLTYDTKKDRDYLVKILTKMHNNKDDMIKQIGDSTVQLCKGILLRIITNRHFLYLHSCFCC